MAIFLICVFILLLQFLWKYIDDLVGKGLEWQVIAELLFYASLTLIPLALPLSILLATIMTFGNLGEKRTICDEVWWNIFIQNNVSTFCLKFNNKYFRILFF